RWIAWRVLEWAARANRGAVPGRVRQHLVQHREVDRLLGRERRRFGDGKHLRGIDELIAQLDDLAHPGTTDMHDQTGERLDRGSSAFEDISAATDHHRQRPSLRADGPAREWRVE